MESFFGTTVGVPTTLEVLARQNLISRSIYDVIKNADTTTAMALQANRGMANKGWGAMVAANEWLPVFKACMTAVAIGLIPVLAAFVASPLVGRALSFIFGIFIFLAAWGVADAVVTASGSYFVNEVMESVRKSGLGVETWLNFPDTATKAASVFGTLRSMAVGFAGVISFMLVKFGGHFMSGMAGNIMGQMQGAGGQAGAMATPEGRSQMMQNMVSSAGVEGWANSYGFQQMAAGDSWRRSWGTEGAVAGGQMTASLGMSPGQFMRASLSHFNVGTPVGAYSGTMSPDGGGIVNSSLNNLGQTSGMSGNWKMRGTHGPNGEPGFTRFDSGAGNFTLQNGPGGARLADANIAGLGGSLANQRQEQFRERGIEGWTSSSNYDQSLATMKEDAKTDKSAAAFRSTLSNARQESYGRAVTNNSQLANTKSMDTGQTLKGYMNAHAKGGFEVFGLGAGAEVGQQGAVTIKGSDGTSFRFDASTTEGNEARKSLQAAEEQSLTQATETTEGRKYAAGLAERTGNGESASYLKESMSSNSASAQMELKQVPAFLDSVATQMAQGEAPTPEHYQQAAEKLNTLATGTPQQQAEVAGMFNDFLNKGYSAVDNNTVLGDINQAKQETQGGYKTAEANATPALTTAQEVLDSNDVPTTTDETGAHLKRPDTAGVFKAADDRESAIKTASQGGPGYDFTTNPMERVLKDVGKIFAPGEDQPHPGMLPGQPQDPTAPKPQHPPAEATPNTGQGASTTGGHNPGAGSFQGNPEVMEQLTQFLADQKGGNNFSSGDDEDVKP